MFHITFKDGAEFMVLAKDKKAALARIPFFNAEPKSIVKTSDMFRIN